MPPVEHKRKVRPRLDAVAAGLAAILLLTPLLPARAQTAQEVVSWSAEVRPSEAAPGAPLQLHLAAQIGDGWKMYAMDSPPPTRGVKITTEDTLGILFTDAAAQSEPEEGYDPNFDMDVRYFHERAQFTLSGRVEDGASLGERVVEGSVRFMVCNARLCLPPTSVPFTAAVTVVQTAALAGDTGIKAPADSAALQPVLPPEENRAELTGGTAGETTSKNAGRQGSGGLWAFLLLAVGAGLATLLTPCVFPLIPLTVSYFTRHAEGRGEAVRMATVYGLAIVLTFTSLGLLMALFLGAAGAQTIAANPWVNLFIGVVFVVFALSLLGLFELRLPSGMVNFFNRQGNERAGYVGVLFMGLTLTLVSFSCTAPFVGGLLAATVQGERFYPLIGMLTFSTTFALPFVGFALFPKSLSALPKSGSWMNAVKVVLGFVELAAAIKFLSNADLIWGWGLISRPVAIAVIVVIFFLAGLYLIGKLQLTHEPSPEHVGVGRLLFAIGFFGLSLFMIPGLFGASLNKLDAYLPPRQGTDASLLPAFSRTTSADDETELPWFVDDIDAARAAAKAQNLPLFIDFTGYTCTNCREMEANVFPRPEVSRRFEEDFVLLRLYTDGLENGEEFQRYQLQTTGTVALPTYAVLAPEDGHVVAQISGLTSLENFVAFLDEGSAPFVGRSPAATSAGV